METDPIRILKVDATFAYKLGDQIKSEGNHGTLVFKGLFNGTIPIALKRYQKVDEKTTIDLQKDLNILASPENRHPNFIRYYGHTSDDNFSYLAMEWCECSVADIIDPKKGKENPKKISARIKEAVLINLTHKEILRQSSEAVSFLHSLGKIHRNLHPDNFLISCVDPSMDHFLIKLTDFQLSKDIKTNPENTGTTAKEGWVAPESFENKNKLTNKVDSFIMGCYYYYVLTGGKHPFGKGVVDQRTRIRNKTDEVYPPNNWNGGPNWKDNIESTTIHEEEATWALDMIKDLIKYEESERKSVKDVLLENKYFQPEGYKIYHRPQANTKPGLCVIITQAKYHNPFQDCCWEDYSGETYQGVNKDAENLIKTFSSFGYDIIHLKNLRADEIIKYMSPNELSNMLPKKENDKPSFKDYASLVVCYLGHGNQGVVIGVDDHKVPLNQIQYDAFDNNHCPDLKGKPKVFIILACQGENRQKEIQKNSNEVLMSASPLTMATPTSNLKNEELNRPPVFDFIRLMATIEGYTAAGGWNTGSSFINSLCKALNHEYKEKLINREKDEDKYKEEEKKILKKSLGKRDLTQLFTTFVTPVVGSNAEYWQTPEFRSSLSKTIRFRRIQDPVPVEPFYDGETKPPFQHAREYNKSLGWKAKKLISDSDCTAVWYTLEAEAPGNGEVQKAIAWVILNRYNLNIKDWGGNKSLKDVCMYQGIDKFNCWRNPSTNPGHFDKNTLISIQNWLIYVYEGHDPSLGATNYYLDDNVSGRLPEDLEPTTIIHNYYFYKLR